jgi:hypothetical protein
MHPQRLVVVVSLEALAGTLRRVERCPTALLVAPVAPALEAAAAAHTRACSSLSASPPLRRVRTHHLPSCRRRG